MLQLRKYSKNHIIKKKSALIYKLYKILNKLNINNLSQNKNREKNNLIITLQNDLSLKNLFQNKSIIYTCCAFRIHFNEKSQIINI
jgi:hypothetical protein